jgi:hypothetical protein
MIRTNYKENEDRNLSIVFRTSTLLIFSALFRRTREKFLGENKFFFRLGEIENSKSLDIIFATLILFSLATILVEFIARKIISSKNEITEDREFTSYN